MGLYKSQGREEEERGSQDKQKMAGEPETQQPKYHGEAGHLWVLSGGLGPGSRVICAWPPAWGERGGRALEVSCCVLSHSEEEVTFGGQGCAENDPEGLTCSSKSMPGTGVTQGQRCQGSSAE